MDLRNAGSTAKFLIRDRDAKLTADWKSWAIHQYTDSPVDQNVSALTPEQLRGLGRPAA